MILNFGTVAKSITVAGGLSLIGLLGSATTASAQYMTTQCDEDGDHCWAVQCDNDGDDCYRVRDYDRYAYHRRWICDWDGDNCYWAYDRDYRPYHRAPELGFSFGW